MTFPPSRTLSDPASRNPLQQASSVWKVIDASQRYCAPWAHATEDGVRGAYARAPEHALGPLAGKIFGVKDNIDVAGFVSACGSPLYNHYVPQYDASCVSLLREAGAVPVGKTVTAEFAFACPGPTANPWNLAHTPGGSSSGSAAAVACGAVDFALGTQTGGSIIRPAAFCGVIGFKPTRGAVHRAGLRLLSDTLDTIGWFARSIEIADAVARVLLPDASALDDTGVKRIGFIDAAGLSSLDPAAYAVLLNAASRLRALGVDVTIIDASAALATLLRCHRTIMSHEMVRGLHAESSNDRHRLSKVLQHALATGGAITGHQYRAAQTEAARAGAEMLTLCAGCDFLLAPSAPGPAPMELGNTGDSVFNRVWSMLGWPALHLPTAFDPGGLPLGVQLVGHAHDDHRLLDAARVLHPALDAREGRVLAPMPLFQIAGQADDAESK